MAKYANIFVFIALLIINLVAIKIKKEKENKYGIKGILAGGSIIIYLLYITYDTLFSS